MSFFILLPLWMKNKNKQGQKDAAILFAEGDAIPELELGPHVEFHWSRAFPFSSLFPVRSSLRVFFTCVVQFRSVASLLLGSGS